MGKSVLRCRMSNKKGMILDNILPILVLLGVLILLAFGLTFTAAESTEQKKVSNFAAHHEGQRLLYQYLDESIEYNGQQMNIVDFIKTVKNDDPKEKINLFKEHAANFFDKSPTMPCWRVFLTEGNKEKFVAEGFSIILSDWGYFAEGQRCTTVLDAFDYSIIIPTQQRFVSIHINVFRGAANG